MALKEYLRENERAFNYYLRMFYSLYLNMFEWLNLPDNIPERFIETMLTEKGMCIFFQDEVLERKVVMGCTLGPDPDIYWVPKVRHAYAVNGYSRELSEDDSVVIFNNYSWDNNMDTVLYFAHKIADIDRTIDVNVAAQKTPLIITCSENQRLTFENLIAQYQGNKPLILGNKGLDINAIQVLKLDAPYVAEDLYTLKQKYMQEFFARVGVNMPLDKNERYLTAEILSDNSSVMAQRYTMLNARRTAAQQINEMFGTDIQVNFRQQIAALDIDAATTTSYGTKDSPQLRPEGGNEPWPITP